MKKHLNAALLIALLLASVGTTLGQIRVYRGGESGYLGVEIRNVENDDLRSLNLAKQAGVVVESVESGSAAEEAGLQEGDVIIEYAGNQILGVRHLQRLVSETPPGREIEIAISRSGSRQSLTTRVGERESDFGSRIADGIRMPGFNWSFDDENHDFHVDRDDGGKSVFITTSRPRLGVTGTSLTKQMAEFLGAPDENGILVMNVKEGSPAEDAGIKAGDVLVSVDGRSVYRLHHLSRRLDSGKHEIELYRGGKLTTVEVDIERKNTGGSRKRM